MALIRAKRGTTPHTSTLSSIFLPKLSTAGPGNSDFFHEVFLHYSPLGWLPGLLKFHSTRTGMPRASIEKDNFLEEDQSRESIQRHLHSHQWLKLWRRIHGGSKLAQHVPSRSLRLCDCSQLTSDSNSWTRNIHPIFLI